MLVFDHIAINTNEFMEVYTVDVYRVESMILTWPSATGRVYSVHYGTDVTDLNAILATNLPATPSLNSYTCAVHSAEYTSRYYQIQVEME